MRAYINNIKENLIKNYSHEKEYIQAVTNFLDQSEEYLLSMPILKEKALLESVIMPNKVIQFKVYWQKDDGSYCVNTGYRVQHNNALGVYKGGIRFHPSVNLSILKFLAFEQTLKNALTGLPLGGAKGGSDFDPKGKSDNEIMRFCQSFILELSKHIGPYIDVPAGDIGVSQKEIGYMFGMYKKLTDKHVGVLTGKGPSYGGSLIRPEATGYGLIYMTLDVLETFYQTNIKDKKLIISGSGNVALYAALKATSLGAKVVAMSDSNGFIYDGDGLDIEYIFKIKGNKKRIKDYLEKYRNTVFNENSKEIWQMPCDIALPCATQNELDEIAAKHLIKNGVIAVLEGANMPTTQAGEKEFISNNIIYVPGKASNAGGVSVSLLEMQQNATFSKWTSNEVDEKLKTIMHQIFLGILKEAESLGDNKKLAQASDILGFKRVIEAMILQGV